MARTDPKKWHPDVVESLHAFAGIFLAETIAKKLNAKHGTDFTKRAVQIKLAEEAIDGRLSQGDLILSDAARVLGVSVELVHRWCKKNGVITYGAGKYRYIPEADWERLKVEFTPPEEPTVSSLEAGIIMHYHRATIGTLVKQGHLEGVLFRNKWRVTLRSIERYAKVKQPGFKIRWFDVAAALAEAAKDPFYWRVTAKSLRSYYPDCYAEAMARSERMAELDAGVVQMEDYRAPQAVAL